VASNKQQINWEEIKESTRKTWKSATPKREFVQNIEQLSLSRNKRINMEQNKQIQS